MAFSITPNATQLYSAVSRKLESNFNFFDVSSYRNHFDRVKSAITQSMQGLNQTAVILGAGSLFDIPVESLSEKFDRIYLIDINKSNTERALSRFSPTIQGKFIVMEADFTGIMAELSTKVEQIAEEQLSYEGFVGRVLDILPTLTRQKMKCIPATSFVCSALVASQLAPIVSMYLNQIAIFKFNQNFNVPPDRAPQFEKFKHKIQNDHIDDLYDLVPSGGKAYFADHFSSYNTCIITCSPNIVAQEGRVAFPETVGMKAHLDRKFQTLQQDEWEWSIPQSSKQETLQGVAVLVHHYETYIISSFALSKATL